MQERAHPRYAIELDAELAVDGGSVLHGRTHDISRGGFCVLVPAAITAPALGSPCSIKLALVFSETEFSEQLALRGFIAWCTQLRGGTQLGVRFEALDAASRAYLDLFMKFLEEGAEPDEPSSPG